MRTEVSLARASRCLAPFHLKRREAQPPALDCVTLKKIRQRRKLERQILFSTGGVATKDVKCDVRRMRMYLGNLYTESGQTSQCSMSDVSTALMAKIGVCLSIFRDRQDFHSFAPLRTQNFGKQLLEYQTMCMFYMINFSQNNLANCKCIVFPSWLIIVSRNVA